MRPLFHPAADEVTVEGILHALADPVRVKIFAMIVKSEAAQACVACAEVCDLALPKSTLSQHFRVLREAGLIRSERKGVEMLNTPRGDDVLARFQPLITAIVDAHNAQVAREQKSRKKKLAKTSA